eukprot:CAMPEP_0119054954 /NCGR_PEP_ID=MMETSP1177-20130426/75414_1 /TAXON_ID=2985 /ORGANISM="Ochromonas sp, Strain CCMP1899" /LENGTH=216 /DNA_ID=CAMNT_0007035367 /DNA_START=2194 /DNA_END=2840 /DNA_ORIENTATION=+
MNQDIELKSEKEKLILNLNKMIEKNSDNQSYVNYKNNLDIEVEDKKLAQKSLGDMHTDTSHRVQLLSFIVDHDDSISHKSPADSTIQHFLGGRGIAINAKRRKECQLLKNENGKLSNEMAILLRLLEEYQHLDLPKVTFDTIPPAIRSILMDNDDVYSLDSMVEEEVESRDGIVLEVDDTVSTVTRARTVSTAAGAFEDIYPDKNQNINIISANEA